MPSRLPDLSDLHKAATVVDIPLRVPFRGVLHREVLLLRGPAGWGEFGPFLEYGAVESSRWLASAVEAAWQGFPAPLRGRVPVNATVPAVPPKKQVPAVLARFPGCSTAKVKVAERSQHLRDDVCRVAAVRDVLGPTGVIRVDANGAWTVEQARRALGELAAYGLDYAEQPCASVPELVALRAALARDGVPVRIAADESIRKAEDPMLVARAGAADLIVVKVAPLGGVRAALRIVVECGLPAVVSSALDTSVGMSSGVALAAALPELAGACGLGTVALLGGDVAKPSLLPESGELAVGPVVVDEELLHRWAAPPDRVAWWQERLAECWRVLAQG